MTKTRRPPEGRGVRTASPELVLEGEKYFEGLATGTWSPAVDICETRENVTVRVELPGIDEKDVRVIMQGGVLRVQGVKREPTSSQKLLCYYCLERSYGKFNREVRIDWVVDARRSRAVLEKGILTIELPKLKERREALFEISVSKR
jgi:HSP20 family protein